MIVLSPRRGFVTKRRSLAFVAALSTGCAPLYPVQIAPTGPDTYIATQTSLSSWLDARTAAMQRAADWCAKKGGQFAVTDSEQERVALPVASNDHATVAFTCKGITR
jgi:hypothetical protein